MATKAELSNFSPEELHDFLATKFGFEVSMESLDSIKNNKIGGMTFWNLEVMKLRSSFLCLVKGKPFNV